jgi:hypothetical protein
MRVLSHRRRRTVGWDDETDGLLYTHTQGKTLNALAGPDLVLITGVE